MFSNAENLPGPGQYEILKYSDKNAEVKIQRKNLKTKPLNNISFGSSIDRETVFLNRDITCPFQDKS